MSMGPFPVNPQQRKMILVMKDTDIQRCQMEKASTQCLIDDQVYVMPFPIQVSPQDSPTQKALARMAKPGMVLSQSPFDPGHYFDAAHESVEIAVNKYLVFSALCGTLGARSVSIEQITYKTRTKKTEWNAKASHGVGGVESSGGNEKINELRQRISLKDEYQGNTPDIDQANALLEKTGLTMEGQFQALIDARRYQSNLLKKREVELSLYNNLHSNLNILATFQTKIPGFIKGSLSFTYDVKETEEISVKILVEF